MRRRSPNVDPDDIPDRLRRYVEAEWVGAQPNSVEAWYDARSDWLEANPDRELPDAPHWPDAPFDPSRV